MFGFASRKGSLNFSAAAVAVVAKPRRIAALNNFLIVRESLKYYWCSFAVNRNYEKSIIDGSFIKISGIVKRILRDRVIGMCSRKPIQISKVSILLLKKIWDSTGEVRASGTLSN